MLIKIGNIGGKKPVLPKLNVKKASPKQRKVAANDTVVVQHRMEKLFGNYNWRVVTTEEELVNFLLANKELGFDTETSGLDIFKSELVGVSFGNSNECIYVPLRHKVGNNYAGNIEDLQYLLDDLKLYGFNAKFDIKALKLKEGLDVKAHWCGYLAARIMNSAEPSNSLEDLYVKYIDSDDDIYSFRTLFNMSFDSYDPKIVGGYAAVDALKHYRLGKWQELNIHESDLKILQRLEMPLTHVLVNIELTGIALDVEWTRKLTAMLNADLDKIKEDFESMFPGFNPGSPKQVAELLYDKLKLPMLKGRGTGADILTQLEHPLAEKILEYRTIQKQLSTYAGKMESEAVNGIVHTTFNQYGADTGRFSSSDPNLQNIPRDERFRKMFKARDGHLLASCDYSQQEVYILASLANDETMKKAYAENMDFYAYMASIVFEVDYNECIKGGKHAYLRDQMKSIVLGINYDMGITTLAKDIGKTVKETQAIYDKFFETAPAVKPFRQARLDFAIKHGYVETILGRKRRLSALHLPDFSSEDKDVENMLNSLKNNYAINKLTQDAKAAGIEVIDRRFQKAYETRQVVNSAVQGSAADMTKLAILVAVEDEEFNALGGKILMQIHDEIVAEFPEETAQEGAERLAEIMIDVGSDLIGIRMKSTPTIMRSWGS